MFAYPLMFAPVPVTKRTLDVPATDTPTLPFTAFMFTFDVPFEIFGIMVLTVAHDSTPEPFVCKYCPVVPPVIVTLPTGPKFEVWVTARVPSDALFAVTALPLIFPFASRTTIVFAEVVTEVLYPSTKSAFRFATLVVEFTVIGAVPVATLDDNVTAVTIPVEFKFATFALPPTSKILLA